MSKYRKDIGQAEFEQIERYVLDRMDNAEREVFEVKLSTDEMLRNEVILQRQLMATVETGTLAAERKTLQQVPSPTPLRKLAHYRRYAAAIVLIAGAGLFSWWYYTADPEQDLYTTYFRPDLGLPVVMSSDSTTYLFNEGMVSYKEGNYGDAIGVWEELVAKKGVTDTLLYYIGAAQLNIGNRAVASDYLKTVSEHGHSVFREKAVWYLALLRLKEKDHTGAKHLLIQLPEKKEAVELLRKIGD